jgi:hypothetical protein
MEAMEEVHCSLSNLIYKSDNQIEVFKGKAKQKHKVSELKFVKCINNIGYEESFEKDSAYVLKKDTGDFFIVEDIFTNDVEVFKDRFEVVK